MKRAKRRLPNRNLLADRLQQALAGAQRQRGFVGVVAIDLDRFKLVNDSYGRGTGDAVLCRVAALVEQRLHSSDTVARTGGDEFVAIVRGLDHEGAFGSLIEDLRRAIAEPFEIDGIQLMVTASVGAAIFPRDAQDAQALLRSADLGVGRAKALGGNQWRFATGDVNAQLREQLELQSQLHNAVARDELRLFYQPVIDVASGCIVGAEALLRWAHPTRGLLLPADFIQLAERTGLIVPIGLWVLDAACGQLARWSKDGLGRLHLAVNVGGRQFHDDGFVRGVCDTLARHGVAAERLELEVSERHASHNDAAAIAALDELKRAGVTLALDDFGVGATSISALTRLPVDRIKLDRRLVNGLPDSSEERAIVSGLLGILRALGFTSVAEGVERPEQLDLLRELRCDQAQGFLLGRPVPPAQFEGLLH
ncbi:MAG: bifunctional diguanylate cyclase/phosphodiesterase [Pseudomonadota bacterium]